MDGVLWNLQVRAADGSWLEGSRFGLTHTFLLAEQKWLKVGNV